MFINKKYTRIVYLDVLNLRIGRIAAGSSRLEYFVLYVLYLDTYHAYIRYITYDVRKDVCTVGTQKNYGIWGDGC